jgi:hypothetical protein
MFLGRVNFVEFLNGVVHSRLFIFFCIYLSSNQES